MATNALEGVSESLFDQLPHQSQQYHGHYHRHSQDSTQAVAAATAATVSDEERKAKKTGKSTPRRRSRWVHWGSMLPWPRCYTSVRKSGGYVGSVKPTRWAQGVTPYRGTPPHRIPPPAITSAMLSREGGREGKVYSYFACLVVTPWGFGYLL